LFLLDLAAKLKQKKHAGVRGNLLGGKNIVLCLKKHPPARDARLKSRAMTKVQT
jgi:hypothetical protein